MAELFYFSLWAEIDSFNLDLENSHQTHRDTNHHLELGDLNCACTSND
jgi:hypothetical protein